MRCELVKGAGRREVRLGGTTRADSRRTASCHGRVDSFMSLRERPEMVIEVSQRDNGQESVLSRWMLELVPSVSATCEPA